MDQDICVCNLPRSAHPAAATPDAAGCLEFVRDAKASYWAAKGTKKLRGRRIVTLMRCSSCNGTQGPFERVEGRMYHRGCPGPRLTPKMPDGSPIHPGFHTVNLKMPGAR